jgi:hypothetical protein
MANQFNYRDVTIYLLGKKLTGAQGVKYSVKVEKEALYGRGNKAMSIQTGNESVEGELKILQMELELLIAAVKLKDPLAKITDFSFDLVVVYQQGLKAITDVIQGVEFSEYEKGLEQGDKFMEISLKFLALDVIHQKP